MKCIVQHNKKNPDRSDTKKKCSLCPDFSVMQSAPIHSSALICKHSLGFFEVTYVVCSWAFSRLYMYVLPRFYFAASISLKIPFMTKAARKKVQRSAMGWEIWIPRRPRIGVRISSAGIRKSPWRPMETSVARMP